MQAIITTSKRNKDKTTTVQARTALTHSEERHLRNAVRSLQAIQRSFEKKSLEHRLSHTHKINARMIHFALMQTHCCLSQHFFGEWPLPIQLTKPIRKPVSSR